jgi:hypothetical protein
VSVYSHCHAHGIRLILGAVYSCECTASDFCEGDATVSVYSLGLLCGRHYCDCIQPLSRARNQTYFSVPYTAASVYSLGLLCGRHDYDCIQPLSRARNQTNFSVPYTAVSVYSWGLLCGRRYYVYSHSHAHGIRLLLGAIYSCECLQLGTDLWETILCIQPLSCARNQTYFSVPYTAPSVYSWGLLCGRRYCDCIQPLSRARNQISPCRIQL